MTAKKRGRGPRGSQPSVRGFRPGKAPAHLKKQLAKDRLAGDASWLQKQTVESIAGRTPGEVRTMVQKWSRGLVVGALLLAGLGIFVLTQTLAAGLIVEGFALILLFLAYRLRKQGPGLVDMAEALH
jgi:hypothetical protein